MSFEDLVSKSRKEHNEGERAKVDAPATLEGARAALDAALGKTGLSAAMALASHGVPGVPIGHIKQRFGFEYPEQTSRAWKFPRDVYLLRDGTWWHAGTATATTVNAPPPVFRWAMGEDGESPGSILEARTQLTGAVLKSTDAAAADAPHGSFTVEGAGPEQTLDFWVVDGVARIAEGDGFGSARPFEEWAAAHVARLIDTRA